jgi:hypothetical protein
MVSRLISKDEVPTRTKALSDMRHNGHRSLCGCESRHGKMVRFCREHRPLELTEEQRQIATERLRILEEDPPRSVGYPELESYDEYENVCGCIFYQTDAVFRQHKKCEGHLKYDVIYPTSVCLRCFHYFSSITVNSSHGEYTEYRYEGIRLCDGHR